MTIFLRIFSETAKIKRLYVQINVLCVAILPTDSLVAHITLYIINIFRKSHFCVKEETCDLNDLDDLGNGINYLDAEYCTQINVCNQLSFEFFSTFHTQYKMACLLTPEAEKVKKSLKFLKIILIKIMLKTVNDM